MKNQYHACLADSNRAGIANRKVDGRVIVYHHGTELHVDRCCFCGQHHSHSSQELIDISGSGDAVFQAARELAHIIVKGIGLNTKCGKGIYTVTIPLPTPPKVWYAKPSARLQEFERLAQLIPFFEREYTSRDCICAVIERKIKAAHQEFENDSVIPCCFPSLPAFGHDDRKHQDEHVCARHAGHGVNLR
jgi:hypothetical protein